MTNLPLLYTYRRCPYAMRARMALLVAGVVIDAYEISLRQKPPAMLAASPKGTVPILVLPNGTVIEQSLELMRWAFEQHDKDSWWARSLTADNQALIAINDGVFKQQLDHYKYPQRFSDGDGTFYRDKAIQGLLQRIELRLADQPHLGGREACATDIAIFPFVRQFRAVDADWFDSLPLHATQAWLQGWLASLLFKDCMKKLPTGVRITF
jgi:glutathione S-transferase